MHNNDVWKSHTIFCCSKQLDIVYWILKDILGEGEGEEGSEGGDEGEATK